MQIDLAAYARFADAQEGLGVLSKIYTSTQAHLDVLEVALPRCPVPSPFMIGAGELVIPSTFLAPAMPAVLAVPFVPAVAATAAVAALTLYDMCKAADRGMVMTDVKLLEKQGGKSGHWSLEK